MSPISKNKKSGIVPFGYEFLQTQGKLFLVGFGNDKKEVEELFQFVEYI